MADLRMTPARLTDRQERILGRAADNHGRIYVGHWMDPADRKAADALVRAGILSPGSGLYGADARHITDHGRRVLDALDATTEPEEN